MCFTPIRLFDICPGLSSLELTTSRHGESKGLAIASYGTAYCASYAKQKLNNVEFPPGYRLSVNYKHDRDVRMPPFQQQQNLPGHGGMGMVSSGVLSLNINKGVAVNSVN